MKPAKVPYAVVTGTVVISLLVAGATEWLDSGIGAGWRSFCDVLRFTAYCVGAVGVIWLGWYWLRLARAIASTASQMQQHIASGICPGQRPTGLQDPTAHRTAGHNTPAFQVKLTEAIELTEAIVGYVDSYSEATEQLLEQIEQLQIQTRLSNKQRRNTEAIIYSLPDAVIVFDEFDRLLIANEAAGKLFNFDHEGSQHQSIDEIFGAENTGTGKRKFADFLRQSRKAKTQATRREIELSSEFASQQEDGTPARAAVNPRTYDCIVSCVHDDSQHVCGIAAALHDVTREKEISQMKNDFVSHVSHELKTPLASITAYAEMLCDGEAADEETRRKFYSVIQTQAERLNRLIEDILNISRIESGLIKVDKTPLSLMILIEEQLQMIRSYAEQKNVEISGQKPIVYDQVYADKDMLSQVIINLLSNAVKYTRAGGSVKITTEVDEDARLARVSITDTGVGIPADQIEHVFDKFYRVGANKKLAQGTGLGLNLVKQIVERIHNGRVFVTSQVDVGSTFGFELPLATEQKVEAA
ncbi:MAG: PAS domain-containing protein [Phycisphaerales bacterium]|nr:MAG: PAS domain-containing protein [Phycisphaerales bacterium]